jgi:hypothetical protein
MLIRRKAIFFVVIALVVCNDSIAVAQMLVNRGESKTSCVLADYGIPGAALGCIDIPSCKRKLSLSNWGDTICYFLSSYFQLRFGEHARLTGQEPPTESLEYVRGFITGENYCESEEITIDHLELVGGKLKFECWIGGSYLKLKSPCMTKDRFVDAIDLKKDYKTQIDNQCICLVDSLQIYLIKKS